MQASVLQLLRYDEVSEAGTLALAVIFKILEDEGQIGSRPIS